MHFALVLLAVLAYIHVGYHLGDLSLKLWLDKDNASLRSFLLFPVSHVKGCVGEEGRNILSAMDFKGKVWEGDNPGPGMYRICVMLLWPAKLAFNLPAVLLYGGIRAVDARLASRAKAAALPRLPEEPDHLLPADGDAIPVLVEKHRIVSEKIDALEALRKAIDDSLAARKREADAAVETVEHDVHASPHEGGASAKTGVKEIG